jgi:MFS transporter, putative metabolite:H+ symporter
MKKPQLTANQWKIVTFCALGGMLETMDIYIISFVLTAIAQPWQLTYGKSATILLASGVGAIIGSLFWGLLTDRIGRKKAFIATIFVCAAGSLAMAFTPTGNWIYLVVLRTVVGFGAAGFFIFVMTVQEFAPAQNRGFATGFVSTAAAGGLLVGSICASLFMPVIGWRGLFAIGALPALVGIAAIYYLPESPRWALARGDFALGRRSLAWALGPDADIEPIVHAYSAREQKPTWREVFARKRSALSGMLINFGVVTGYYGITLWAPTLLALILGLPAAQAAKIMVVLSLSGLLSRLMMGWLADHFGRRRCGAVAAFGAAVFLVLAGMVGQGLILRQDLFWLPFGFAFVLADSGFAVMGMYTSEIWPSRLRGRGSGMCYMAGSVGKIVGPLGLALLIGASSMLRPAATVSALLPAFTYLAAMFIVAGLTYAFIAYETRGQTLEDLETRLA